MRFIASPPQTIKDGLWRRNLVVLKRLKLQPPLTACEDMTGSPGAEVAHAAAPGANAFCRLCVHWALHSPSPGEILKRISKVHRPQSWEVLSHHFQFPRHTHRRTEVREGKLEARVIQEVSGRENTRIWSLNPVPEIFFLYPLLFCYGPWFFMTWPQPPLYLPLLQVSPLIILLQPHGILVCLKHTMQAPFSGPLCFPSVTEHSLSQLHGPLPLFI